MNVAVFILAGGSGIRLWPVSRKTNPKQFLPMFSDGTSFFDKTLSRAMRLTSPENIFILTQRSYYELVKKSVKEIPLKNIITEPEKKNTAPAIAYSMMKLHKTHGNTTAVILPSDHHITEDMLFIEAVSDACSIARTTNGIVTIGILPSRPATTYGYIEYDKAFFRNNCYKAVSFKEKPDIQTAQKFLFSENHLWNSGIFVWNTEAVLEEFRKYAPEIYEKADQMCITANKDTADNIYSTMPSLSVDYAILEKTDNLFTVKGNFGWDDIGSWERYEVLYPKDSDGNSSDSNSILIDTRNCTAISRGSKLLMIGTENIFVVNTNDAVLIFPKDKTNKIGNLSEILTRSGFDELM